MGYYDSLELAVRLSELLALYAKNQPLSLQQQKIWERCYPIIKQLLAKPQVSRAYTGWLRNIDNRQAKENFQSSMLVEWSKSSAMEEQLAVALKVPYEPFPFDTPQENSEQETDPAANPDTDGVEAVQLDRAIPVADPVINKPQTASEGLNKNNNALQQALTLLSNDPQILQLLLKLASDDRRYTNLLLRLHNKDFINLLLNLGNNPELETNVHRMIQSGAGLQAHADAIRKVAGEDLNIEGDPFISELISRLNEDRFYELVKELSQSRGNRELAYQIFSNPDLPELAARLSQDKELMGFVDCLTEDKAYQDVIKVLTGGEEQARAILAVAKNPDYAALVSHMIADEGKQTGFNQVVERLSKDPEYLKEIYNKKRDPLLDGILATLTSRPLTPEVIAKKLCDLGDHLQNNNWTEDAITVFTLCLRLDPTVRPAYYGRAQAYLSKNMYPQAIQDLKTLISQNEKDTAAHLALGKIYLDLNLIDEAIEVFKKSRQLIAEQA